MIIRKIQRVTDEHLAFIEQHHDGYVIESTDGYSANRESPNYLLYEARIGEELVGIGFVTIDDHKTKRSITVVHRNYRGQGIGSALLEKRVRAVKELGIDYTTQVLLKNVPSFRMCKKHLDVVDLAGDILRFKGTKE